jgi:hypothetical protein
MTDAFRNSIGIFVLPNPDDFPSGASKRRVDFLVAMLRSFELWKPVFDVPRRRPIVIGAPMPEATINEYRDPLAAKRDVDRPPYAR